VLTLNSGSTAASFTINSAGSYTNVTNFKFYNTQVFVRNATNVTLDNITCYNNVLVTGSNVLINNSRVDGYIQVNSGLTNVSITNNQYSKRH
jgi:hypothetical protein